MDVDFKPECGRVPCDVLVPHRPRRGAVSFGANVPDPCAGLRRRTTTLGAPRATLRLCSGALASFCARTLLSKRHVPVRPTAM
jgi:hypothetical protein